MFLTKTLQVYRGKREVLSPSACQQEPVLRAVRSGVRSPAWVRDVRLLQIVQTDAEAHPVLYDGYRFIGAFAELRQVYISFVTSVRPPEWYLTLWRRNYFFKFSTLCI